MYNYIKIRVLDEANYIIENNATLRQTAKIFNVGESTVHKDMNSRLNLLDFDTYIKVKEILKINDSEKHIRGGIATKLKYKKTEV